MTINRSDAAIIREVVGMKPELLTDAYVLDLHCRHITTAGQLSGSVNQRRGAILRLSDDLDPYSQDPRAVLDATPEQLAEWQASKTHLATATISAYVVHARQFYAWTVRPMRILEQSPADGLIPPIVRRRRPRPIPEDDYEYALKACTDARLFAWLVLGGYAGLRGIDIAGLDRDDVLLDGDIPFLRVRGKGDNDDLVAIGNEVVAALTPFMQRRGSMFLSDKGARLRARDIYEEVNEYLARIGVPYTFHNCRHRFGTKTYLITRDILFTQQQMRHQSVTSTEGYVAVPTDRATKAVAAMDTDLAKRSRGRRRRDLSA